MQIKYLCEEYDLRDDKSSWKEYTHKFFCTGVKSRDGGKYGYRVDTEILVVDDMGRLRSVNPNSVIEVIYD